MQFHRVCEESGSRREKKTKKKNAVTNVELAASLLEGLDKDEAQEFSDIVNPRTAMKRKWAEIKEEKKMNLGC